MKTKTKFQNRTKGMRAFNAIKFLGMLFVTGRLLVYFRWTFDLIKNWALPEEPFFSKVNLLDSTIELSVGAYLAFSICYIVIFGFVILGMFQMNTTTNLLSADSVFQDKIGVAFKKAGISFIIFALGTFLLDTALLFFASTSNRLMDLLSTELLVFAILGYLMLFLADVFREGITIKEENELTI